MFCHNCGKENSNNNNFCKFCGTEITLPHADTKAVDTVSTGENPIIDKTTSKQTNNLTSHNLSTNKELNTDAKSPYIYEAEPKKVTPQNATVSILKHIILSPSSVISVICYCIFTIFTCINSSSVLSNILSQLRFMLKTDIPYWARQLLDTAGTVSRLINIAPYIVTSIGLLLILYYAYDKTAYWRNFSCFTIIKVISTVTFIISVVRLVAVFICLIVFIVTAILSNILGYYLEYISYLLGTSTSLLILVTIFLTAYCSLAVVYRLDIIKTVDSIKTITKTDKVDNKISSFVALMCYVYAGLQFLSMLIPNSLPSFLISNDINIFAKITSIIAYICFGLTMYKLQDKLTEQKLKN